MLNALMVTQRIALAKSAPATSSARCFATSLESVTKCNVFSLNMVMIGWELLPDTTPPDLDCTDLQDHLLTCWKQQPIVYGGHGQFHIANDPFGSLLRSGRERTDSRNKVLTSYFQFIEQQKASYLNLHFESLNFVSILTARRGFSMINGAATKLFQNWCANFGHVCLCECLSSD